MNMIAPSYVGHSIGHDRQGVEDCKRAKMGLGFVFIDERDIRIGEDDDEQHRLVVDPLTPQGKKPCVGLSSSLSAIPVI